MKYDRMFFKKYAEDLKIGPTELGILIGKSKQAAATYMCGETLPQCDKLWEIAEKLGITDMNVFTVKSKKKKV